MPQLGWNQRRISRLADTVVLKGEHRLQQDDTGFFGSGKELKGDEVVFKKLEQDGRRYLVVETHDGVGGKTRRVLARDAIEKLIDFMVSEEF